MIPSFRPPKAPLPLSVSLCSESSVSPLSLPLPLDPGRVGAKRNVLIFDLHSVLFRVSVLTIQDGIIDIRSMTEDTSFSEEQYLDNQTVICSWLRSSANMRRVSVRVKGLSKPLIATPPTCHMAEWTPSSSIKASLGLGPSMKGLTSVPL